jgi:type II secretory pathway pseudopilin PulG
MLEIVAVVGLMALVVVGATETAMGSFGLISQQQAETVYSQDLLPASRNMSKLVSRAQSFQIFTSRSAAVNNDSSSISPAGTAARLVYADGRIAVLSFEDNAILYENVSPDNNQFVVLSGVDDASFALTDPNRTVVSGLLVISLTRSNRTITFYVEPL